VAAEPTPSQTVGPFFSFGLLAEDASELVAADSPGRVSLSGRVLDGEGEPVPDAMVEIWQADEEGRYRPDFGWGRSGTDAEGRFSFVTRKPGRVADPEGGIQAPHLSMLVFARGLLKPVLTRVYFPGDPANAEDRVLSGLAEDERSTLIAQEADGGLEFDVRLRGDGQTTFFAV
jgi:protocatechuate 3,4-dioxygenase, alpha subunit